MACAAAVSDGIAERRSAPSTARAAQPSIALVLPAQQAVGGELQHERDRLRASPDPPARASADSRRARACVCRPSSRSTPAQAAATDARIAPASGGTISSHSIRVARLSSKRPLPESAAACDSSNSTRSPAGVAADVRRRAAPNQRAALAGARWTAASPASRSVAIAAVSPWRAERSTWWARADAGAPRSSRACGAALVRPEPPAARGRLVDRSADERMAKPEAARHIGLTHEIEEEQFVERRERLCSSLPAAATASSGSKGSPATAAPSSTRRASAESRPSSSAIAAATTCGTCAPPTDRSGVTAGPGPARSSMRASCSR